MVPIDSPYGWFSIWLPLTQSSYLSPFSKYLTCHFGDLEIREFKVIQGQRSWSHWWFPIWPPLSSTSYLSPFSRYLTYFSIAAMVKINFTSGLADRNISDFHQKLGNHIYWDSTLVASLVKIGGRLRPVERSTRFVWQTAWYTDWLTCRHTNWFYNFVQCC